MRDVREGVISAPKDSAVCQIVVLKTSYRERKEGNENQSKKLDLGKKKECKTHVEGSASRGIMPEKTKLHPSRTSPFISGIINCVRVSISFYHNTPNTI